MLKEEVINFLYKQLKNRNVWFITKEDAVSPWVIKPNKFYKLNEYGELKDPDKVFEEISDYIGDGADTMRNAVFKFIDDKLVDGSLANQSDLRTTFKDKPIDSSGTSAEVNTLNFNKARPVLESVQRRLNEENNKSANIISDMFTAEDFDSDSKAGQIVMRTSQLFNALSDKGYDVQVAFDNGESTNNIILGQQGGQVTITITDNNTPLKAFVNGSIELNQDNLKTLDDIAREISSL